MIINESDNKASVGKDATERDAHGVGGAIGEGGSDDGAGGVGRAPRLDDLGGARRLRVGLDDCSRRGNGWSQCYVAARREDEGAGGGGEGRRVAGYL